MDMFNYLLEFAHYNRLEANVQIDPRSRTYEVDLVDTDSKCSFDIKDGACLTGGAYRGETLDAAAKALLEATLDKTMVFNCTSEKNRRELKGAYLNMPGRGNELDELPDALFEDITERGVLYFGNTPYSTSPPKEPYPLPKDPFQKQANIIFQQIVDKQGAIFVRKERKTSDVTVILRIPCIPPEGGNIIARAYEGHGIDLTTSLIKAHGKMIVNFPECKITDPGWIL